MTDLLEPLRRHFGHAAFRDSQEALVRTVLAGQDLLAVMPTGAGKSLGFQLPALLLPGTTLVVSPLISLMKDQVDELNRRGVPAAALHSLLPADVRRETLRGVRAGAYRLLYVAPERFASNAFVDLLRELPVARFIVDEAHCVSEWGHDFRPDYRRLEEAASACRRGDGAGGRPPMAAFTATATPEVRDDIVGLLGLRDPRVVVAGFDRPNITLQVRAVGGETEKHHLLPSLVGTGRALVYASTRKKAEAAAQTLVEAGLESAAYHGGLPETERTRVQERFSRGDLRIVCATNAFGMGIDRPDVETVVHADIPGSLEAYYQEIGRAGRDGRAATATLLWNYADVKTREFLIDVEADEDRGRGPAPDPREVERRKDLDRRKLRRMVAYADAAGCLRATILRYFGDPAAHEPCGACGNCARLAPLGAEDRLLVRKLLAGVARAGERYGRRKIAAMLIGQLDELPEPLTRLSTTGILAGQPLKTMEHWIDAAVAAGLLRASDDQYRTLSLTPSGRDLMSGRLEDVRMSPPAFAKATAGKPRRARATAGKPGGTRAAAGEPGGEAGRRGIADVQAGDSGDADETVVAALRAWRLDEARGRAVAPFVILHDRTLLAIASTLPRSADALGRISGIGPAKLATYGPAILDVVARARPPA